MPSKKKIYGLNDAKAALPSLVARVAAGEEIVIVRAGKPCAKLVPIRAATRPRKPGGWEGQVKIAKDFDAPWA